MTRNVRHPFFATLLMIGSMISLTAGASIARTLFPVFGAGGTTFLRLAFSFLILALVRHPWKHRLNFDQWKWIAIYGLILGVMNLLFYTSISKLPIGLAIGIEFLGPLGLSIALSRTWLDFLWAAFALAGIALIYPHGDTSSVDLNGILFAAAAGIAWALYILVGKKVAEVSSPAMGTTFGILFGALVVSPFGFSAGERLLLNPALILAAIAVGFLSSALPYTLELMALKDMSAKGYGIVVSLEPAIGALAALLILGEKLTPIQLLAIAFVIVASMGSTLASRSERGLDEKVIVP